MNIDKILKKEKTILESMNQSNDSEIRFNLNSLHDSNFKRIVEYYDSISVSPLEYLIGGTLATISGAAGKYIYYDITKSLKVYLNIWVILIGKSTIMKKTTAINYCKEELQRIENLSYSGYQKKLQDYESEVTEAKEQKRKLEIQKPLREYNLIPQDCTVQSLSEILSTSNRGLLVHSEFGSFLNQFNQSYNADGKQFFTNLYDVPEWYEVSRVTKGNTILQRPYLSILAASTIDWVKEFSSETDLRSGFFARFLYFIRNTPDKEYIPLLKLKTLTKQSEKYIDTRGIFDFLTSINSDVDLQITDEAEKLFTQYDIDSYKELLSSDNENELSFKARLLVNTLKFAGLIALSDKSYTVTKENIEDAINISNNLCRPNIEKLLNSELIQDEFSRNEDKVLRTIKNRGGEISRTDLLNTTKIKAKVLDELISNLAQKEMIEIKQNNKAFIYQYKASKLRYD
ncbi:MAG: DUF3987 domain-containing protein [Ignavibacteriaceae bacterium]|nr:DUF3987 domain-containing protein [Ignavibacteriaceae bacterium]